MIKHGQQSVTLSQKRAAVVDAFLLYSYQQASVATKQNYERTTRAERIARTMRLEGEPVTADDVRKFLKLP